MCVCRVGVWKTLSQLYKTLSLGGWPGGADQEQNRKTTNKIQMEQIACVYFGKIMLCHRDTYLTFVFPIGQARYVSCNSSHGHSSSAREGLIWFPGPTLQVCLVLGSCIIKNSKFEALEI